MVLARPTFRLSEVKLDRATALGLAVAGNALVLMLFTLPHRFNAPAAPLQEPAEVAIQAAWRPTTPATRELPVPALPEAPLRAEPVIARVLERTPATHDLTSPALPPAAGDLQAAPHPTAGEPHGLDPSPSAFLEAAVDYAHAPAPPYPPQAMRRGLQGEVILRVLVAEDGRPLRIEVDRSSGHRELDRAAERQILQRWRFQPAQREGRPVQSWVRIPIAFRLDRG